jgi:hypothetical protein
MRSELKISKFVRETLIETFKYDLKSLQKDLYTQHKIMPNSVKG